MHVATNLSGNYLCVAIPTGENFIQMKQVRLIKFIKIPDEIWNTQVYKNLRKDLLNGKKPKMCVRCWREEATGIKSTSKDPNESTKIY